MAAELFDLAADRLEHHAGFVRLEARGTLRIALKAAGIQPENLTSAQLQVVFEKVMPGELESRGVRDVPDVCAAVLADIGSAGSAEENARAASPDEIFRRLGES